MKSTPYSILVAMVLATAAALLIGCAPDEEPVEGEDVPLTTMMPPVPSDPSMTDTSKTQTGPTVTTGTTLAPTEPGREAFLSLRCDMCHAISSAAIRARTEAGPDLSRHTRRRSAQDLATFISGDEHPSEWKGTPEQARQIASWLAQQ